MARVILSDQQAMARAIEIARKGWGFVSPNPAVGCVILNSRAEFVAEGFHAQVGGPHAEIAALNAVKDRSELAGARLFVTLEPCSHHGRTPPCCEALAQLPLAEVIYGIRDPNPLVNGRGIAALEASGIKCRSLAGLENELEELTEVFLYNQQHNSCFVSLKVASSLDGIVALQSGESQWITGEAARAEVQRWRGYYDGVLIGAGTMLKDKPRLNSRAAEFSKKENWVVVLDPKAECAASWETSGLLSVRSPSRVIWVVGQDCEVEAPVQIWKRDLKSGEFDLKALMRDLYRQGICSILVEGGAYTWSQFLSQGAAQRLLQFVAPKILGAGGGISWTNQLGVSSLAEALVLSRARRESFGADLLITGRLS